jgi:phospholipid-binding lipoprotein MlaA
MLPRFAGPMPLVLLPVVLLLATGGCAGSAGTGQYEPPRRSLDTVSMDPAQARDVLVVSDPLEDTNRRVYKFNAQLDQYVLVPVVDAYQFVVPSFLRRRVTSFFLNLAEISIFTNSVLQASPSKATPTLGRFMINSTVGLFGLFDVATELGVPRQIADFGQTLAVWGADTGPYLVLPALGPSNMRDAIGTAVDWATLSFAIPSSILDKTLYDYAPIGLQPTDTRYQVPFRYHSTGSPFEYELVRYAATIVRKVEINSPSPLPE